MVVAQSGNFLDTDAFAKTADVIGQGLAKGVAEGIEKGVPRAIEATSVAMRNQFAQDGNGYKTISNIFSSFGDQFKKSGSGSGAINQFWTAISNSFADDGPARSAATNAGVTAGAFVDKLGRSLSALFLRNALIAVGTSLGIATASYGSKVLWSYIDREMRKPKIIIKSSHKGIFARVKNLVWASVHSIQVQPMIFESSLQQKLDGIIQTTRVINQKIKAGATNVKYRNLLLYGQPGTGKTLFAQQLAEQSGMEFAMASGASFAKKGALEAMDELFAWAENSKGLLLFIDEAESLMPDRDNLNPDSDSYRVLTNFLNYTGTRSNKFMIVLATNKLPIIDEAIHRRIDDLVELPLPALEQRVAVLKAYRDLILKDAKQNSGPFIEQVDLLLSDEKIMQIAQQLDGFSNGDLEGLINIIKTESDALVDGLLSEDLIDRAVHSLIEKKNAFMAERNAARA